MDWLTGDLVLRVIRDAAFLIGACVVAASGLWWFCCDEGRRELRIKWRCWLNARAERRARQIRVEWNPRSTAMRGEFQAK